MINNLKIKKYNNYWLNYYPMKIKILINNIDIKYYIYRYFFFLFINIIIIFCKIIFLKKFIKKLIIFMSCLEENIFEMKE